MSEYGRGDQPGQGTPGYGQQGPPPGAGGPGYGPGPYGPPQNQGPHQPPYGATQAFPAPGPGQYPGPQQGQQGQQGQYPGPQQGWPGGPPTATLQGGPPPNWGGGAPPPPGFDAPRKRRIPIVITAIVAVIALAGAGFGVWTLLKGRGGADSPTAAIQLLAGDLASNNYLDAYSRLAPNEADLATDLSSVIGDQLVRLEIIKPGAQMGVGSFQIKDLTMDEAAAEQVRDNVVINKLTGGTITFDQGTSLPFTDKFASKVFPNGMAPAGQSTTVNIADEVRENGGQPIRIASVQVDGQWYVSLFYTVADYALQSEGKAWPKTSVPAVGAASAEDAVKETLQAAFDGDARRLVELAAPDELQVVHDAGDVIVAEAGRPSPADVKLIELDTTEVDVRGQTAVQLSKAVVESDGQRGTIQRDGDCITASADGEAPQRFCASDVAQQLGTDSDPTLQRILPKLAKAALDLKVVTTQVDGKYYLDPGQTVISLYGDVLGVLEPQDVDALLSMVN